MATETEEIRGIGHSVRRKEDDRFIRGRGNYIDDVQLPGMLHMAILRSPYAHAKMNSIDASAAQAMPGVIAVVTGELMAQHNLAWMPTLSGDTQAVLVDRQGPLPGPGGRRGDRRRPLRRQGRPREDRRRLRAARRRRHPTGRRWPTARR